MDIEAEINTLKQSIRNVLDQQAILDDSLPIRVDGTVTLPPGMPATVTKSNDGIPDTVPGTGFIFGIPQISRPEAEEGILVEARGYRDAAGVKAGDSYTSAQAANLAQLEAAASRLAAEGFRNEAVSAKDIALAAGFAKLKLDWASRGAGVAGDSIVILNDAGTHTDPVTAAANTPNSGVFLWTTDWRRVADTESYRAATSAAAAEAAKDALELVVYLTSERAEYTHTFRTPSGQMALGVRKSDGHLILASERDVDSSFTALEAQVGSLTFTSNRSNVAIGAKSSDNKLLFHVRRTDGHFVDSEGRDLSQLYLDVDPVKIAALTNKVTGSDNLLLVGDSLIENASGVGPAQLIANFAAIGETVTTEFRGLGGQTLEQALGRSNLIPTWVQLAVNGGTGYRTLAASGSTVVAGISHAILNHPGDSNAAEILQPGMLMIGAGIPCTLKRAAGASTYTIERTTPGDAIKTPDKVFFVPDLGGSQYKRLIIWGGTNNMIAGSSAESMYAMLARAIDRHAPALDKICLLMPQWDMRNGQPNRATTYDALYNLLLPDYGAITIDTRGLVNPYNDGSVDDLAYMADGRIAKSLLSGDELHYPAAGTAYSVIWAECVSRLRR